MHTVKCHRLQIAGLIGVLKTEPLGVGVGAPRTRWGFHAMSPGAQLLTFALWKDLYESAAF